MDNREQRAHNKGSFKKGIAFGTLLSLIALVPLLAFFLYFAVTLKSQHAIIQPPVASAASCNHTGRTQNADGSYTFARLQVDGSGTLVDNTGCEVYLLGGQGKQIGQQGGSYSIASTHDFGYVTQLNQTVPMNLLRIPFRPDDWTGNTYMPVAQMGYQDLLKLYITAIEAQGDFVELDKYEGASVESDTTALESMASYYAQDPAVLFDVRNEGFIPNEKDPYNDDKMWLDAIQANDPDALKVTYNHYTDEMMAGKLPLLTETNLLFDDHLYSGFKGSDPETGQHCNEPNKTWQYHLSAVLPPRLAFLHQHHIGLVFNEWGGCYDEPIYNDAMMNFTLQNHVASLSYYFAPSNWFFHHQPDQNAGRTRLTYSVIFASNNEGSTPTPTPSNIPGRKKSEPAQ